MRAKAASFFRHPRWVEALVIAMAVTVWSVSVYSIAGQIGRPYPGFFHTRCIHLFFIYGHLSLIFLCVAIGIFAHLLPTNWS
jgi:hypothetical protein